MIVPRRLGLLPTLAVLSLPALSGASIAETLRVEGITIDGPGGLRIVVPEILATDSSLDEAAVRAIFDADYASALAGLTALDAAEIRLPAITVTTAAPSGDASATVVDTTYRDLRLVAVENGIATAGAFLGGVEISLDSKDAIAFGPLSVDYLDIGGMLGMYGIGVPADVADIAMRRIYSNFRLDNVSFGGEDFRCAVGPATAEEFRARPLENSFNELIGAIHEIEEAEERSRQPPPSAIHTIVMYYVDFLTAFESTAVEIGAVACAGTTEDGRSLAVALGDARIGGFSPGIYPDLALNNLDIEADDGWMRLDNFTWKPIDLSGPIAAIRAAEAPIDAAWLEANWRRLIPAIEGLSLSGFAMDIPSPEDSDARVTASVGAADLTLGAYFNGVPTDVSTSGAGIAIDVPDGEDGAVFRAMGLDRLLLDYDLAAHWNENDSTIAIRQVAVGGEGLGRIALSGTLANAGPDLFSDDPDAMEDAAQSVTVRDLRFEIENAGIVPALLAVAAAEQGMPPAALAAQFVAVARALPIGVLGATDEALGLSQALSDFMTGTPNLAVTLTAIDPAGVPIELFAAAQENPEVLQGALAIEAIAAGEPTPFTFPNISGNGAEGSEPTDKQSGKN